MDTKFINLENSNTSKPHVLILNITDLSIYYTWKNIESSSVHVLIPLGGQNII